MSVAVGAAGVGSLVLASDAAASFLASASFSFVFDRVEISRTTFSTVALRFFCGAKGAAGGSGVAARTTVDAEEVAEDSDADLLRSF